MKKLLLTATLLCVSLVGEGGCLHRSEALRANPEEYREMIGMTYVIKTNFNVYRHPEDRYSEEFFKGAEGYYSLYPSTEMMHVNNRYSRLLGEIPKGARLKVASIVQGVDSRKVAYVVKIEYSQDEIMQGEEAVIRAYTAHPALYVKGNEANGLWDLSSRWFLKEEE